MRRSAPRTPLTTEFRGGSHAVRGRLQNLFRQKTRRPGVILLAAVVLSVSLAGSLVACQAGSKHDMEDLYGVYAGAELVCQSPFLSYLPSQDDIGQWRVTLEEDLVYSTFPEFPADQGSPVYSEIDFETAVAAGFAEYGAFTPDLSGFTRCRAWSVEGLGVLLSLDDQLWLANTFRDGLFLRVYRLTPATDEPMWESTLADLLADPFFVPDLEDWDDPQLLYALPGDGRTLGIVADAHRFAAASDGSLTEQAGDLLLGVVDNRSHRLLAPPVELPGDDNRFTLWREEGTAWLLCASAAADQGTERRSAHLFTFDGAALERVTALPESARVQVYQPGQSSGLPPGAETMFDPQQNADFWSGHRAVPVSEGLELYTQSPEEGWVFLCRILLSSPLIPNEEVVSS